MLERRKTSTDLCVPQLQSSDDPKRLTSREVTNPSCRYQLYMQILNGGRPARVATQTLRDKRVQDPITLIMINIKIIIIMIIIIIIVLAV